MLRYLLFLILPVVLAQPLHAQTELARQSTALAQAALDIRQGIEGAQFASDQMRAELLSGGFAGDMPPAPYAPLLDGLRHHQTQLSPQSALAAGLEQLQSHLKSYAQSLPEDSSARYRATGLSANLAQVISDRDAFHAEAMHLIAEVEAAADMARLNAQMDPDKVQIQTSLTLNRTDAYLDAVSDWLIAATSRIDASTLPPAQ